MTGRRVGVWMLLAITAAWPGGGLQGQPEGEPIVHGHEYTISSSVLGEDRPVYVGLPSTYEQSDEPYPVLYLLDGEAHFLHTHGAVRFLAANGRAPEMIVVAIPNLRGTRTRDLTPPPQGAQDRMRFPDSGGADGFLAFIEDELEPWLDENFRTAPYQVLVGHSFGGLFAAHVLNTRPAAFDAYISISPSLWWDQERVVGSTETLFDRHPELTSALYLTLGDEGGAMLDGTLGFARTLETKAPESFRWKWTPMPDETHTSVPHRSTYDGLEWVFAPWTGAEVIDRLTDEGASALGAVQAHFAELSDRAGYRIPPPFSSVSRAAVSLAEGGRTADARHVAEALVSWYPEHPLARNRMGDVLRTACRMDDARTYYEEAVRMAEAAGSSEALRMALRTELAALDEMMKSGARCDAAR